MKSIKFFFLSFVCFTQMRADAESVYAGTVLDDNSIAGVAGSIISPITVKNEQQKALVSIKEADSVIYDQSLVPQSDVQSLVVRKESPRRFSVEAWCHLPIKDVRKGDYIEWITISYSGEGKTVSKDMSIVDSIEAFGKNAIVRLVDKKTVVDSFKRVRTVEVLDNGDARTISDNYEIANWLDMQTVPAGTEIVKVDECHRNGKTICDKTSYVLESYNSANNEVEIALSQKGTASWYGRKLLTVKFNANRLNSPQCSKKYSYYESIKLSAATLATFASIALLSVFGGN